MVGITREERLRIVLDEWKKAYEKFQQTTDVFDYEAFLRVSERLYGCI